MAKKNGRMIISLKNISISIGILLALGSILWGFAIHSGSLDRVVSDVSDVEKDIKAIDIRVDVVEDVVIVIQNDLKYIRGDLAEQKELSKEILKEIRK